MTTQIQKRAPTQYEQLKHDIVRAMPEIEMSLPENVTPKKFLRVLLNTVLNNPDFLKCTRVSLFSAASKCAADGLFPDNREAAMIPYKSVVQYQPMVGGILKKIRNSKEVPSLFAEVVYKDEHFVFGTSSEKGRYLDHIPNPGGSRGTSENAIACFAMSKLTDGTVDFEVMSKEEVEYIRSKSKANNSPAWREFWGEMAKKTLIKRLAKRLPMSADVEDLLDRDNEDFDFKNARNIEPNGPKESLAEKLKKGNQELDAIEFKDEDHTVVEIPEEVVIKKPADPEAFENFK